MLMEMFILLMRGEIRASDDVSLSVEVRCGVG